MSDVGLRTAQSILRGRAADLSEEDVDELLRAGPVAERSAVARLKSSHHRLAQLLAAGFPPRQVGEITGYNPSYISRLAGTPAFSALIRYYQNHAADQMAALVEEVRSKAMQMLEHATTRALEEDVDFRDLTDFTVKLLDRGGAGPTSTAVHRTEPFDPAKLKEEVDRGQVIDVSPYPVGEGDESEISSPTDAGFESSAGERDSLPTEMGADDEPGPPEELHGGAVV